MTDTRLRGPTGTATHADSMKAPTKPYKNEELHIRAGDVVPNLTLVIDNLPSECTYQALKTWAFEADTAPLWAVVFRSNGHSTGALGFKTMLDAKMAASKLSGALFQGIPVDAKPWRNMDQHSHHLVRSCRYGALFRGRKTYCVFSHGGSCSVDHFPSDVPVVRRRSPRIVGVVGNNVEDDVQVGFDNLDIIANHLGNSFEIGATDALHAHENRESHELHESEFTPAGSDMSLSPDGSEPDGDEDIHDSACARANDFLGRNYVGGN